MRAIRITVVLFSLILISARSEQSQQSVGRSEVNRKQLFHGIEKEIGEWVERRNALDGGEQVGVDRQLAVGPKMVKTHYLASDIYLGHADPNPRPYDIWNDNCHTASNAFVLSANSQQRDARGIVVCGGNPTESAGNHTANWEVLSDGKTCIYNWGKECCYNSRSNPPDIDSESAEACVKLACDDQLGDDTRVLAAGELVEIPGASVCVRKTAGLPINQLSVIGAEFSPDKREQCFSCCDSRANSWNREEWGADRQDQFHNSCLGLCNGFFSDPNRPADKPPTRETRKARDAVLMGEFCSQRTSFFSTSDYFEQCRGCCMDNAMKGTYEHKGFNSCVDVCRSRSQ